MLDWLACNSWIVFVTVLCTATILPVLQVRSLNYKRSRIILNILSGCIISFRVSYNMRGCRLSGPEDFDTLMLLSFSSITFSSKLMLFIGMLIFLFRTSSVSIESLEKNCPNTLAFSTSSVAVTGFPLESTVFNSPILELVFHHLLIYFQNFFRFTLHSAAMFWCFFLFILRVSLHTRFWIVLYVWVTRFYIPCPQPIFTRDFIT